MNAFMYIYYIAIMIYHIIIIHYTLHNGEDNSYIYCNSVIIIIIMANVDHTLYIL